MAQEERSLQRAIDTPRCEASPDVYTIGRDGGLAAVPLRLGITDGRMTEVLSGNLTEGQAVLVGQPARGPTPKSGTSPLSFRLR